MEEIEPLYKQEAKQLMEMLYDKGFLADDISRRGLDAVEEYIAFILQSRVRQHLAGEKLLKQLRGMEMRGADEEGSHVGDQP